MCVQAVIIHFLLANSGRGVIIRKTILRLQVSNEAGTDEEYFAWPYCSWNIHLDLTGLADAIMHC